MATTGSAEDVGLDCQCDFLAPYGSGFVLINGQTIVQLGADFKILRMSDQLGVLERRKSKFACICEDHLIVVRDDRCFVSFDLETFSLVSTERVTDMCGVEYASHAAVVGSRVYVPGKNAENTTVLIELDKRLNRTDELMLSQYTNLTLCSCDAVGSTVLLHTQVDSQGGWDIMLRVDNVRTASTFSAVPCDWGFLDHPFRTLELPDGGRRAVFHQGAAYEVDAHGRASFGFMRPCCQLFRQNWQVVGDGRRWVALTNDRETYVFDVVRDPDLCHPVRFGGVHLKQLVRSGDGGLLGVTYGSFSYDVLDVFDTRYDRVVKLL